jgi:hypothetical protein
MQLASLFHKANVNSKRPKTGDLQSKTGEDGKPSISLEDTFAALAEWNYYTFSQPSPEKKTKVIVGLITWPKKFDCCAAINNETRSDVTVGGLAFLDPIASSTGLFLF